MMVDSEDSTCLMWPDQHYVCPHETIHLCLLLELGRLLPAVLSQSLAVAGVFIFWRI